MQEQLAALRLSALPAITAGGPDELSLCHWDQDEEFPGEDQLLVDGYKPVVLAMGKGIDVRLRRSVRRIVYRSSRVLVETDHNTFEAGRAIITLPLGVL